MRATALRLVALVAGACAGSARAAGTDLYVSEVATSNDIREYGLLGDIAAYAFATATCNSGDQPTNWYDWDGPGSPGAQHHPVFVQNMYRLRDGRFEQVGMSWVKHGFCASNDPGCGTCQSTFSCDRLGVQCVDHYSSFTNGNALKPRSDINASTGEFPFPPSFGAIGPVEIAGRLQVHLANIDPAQNASALYFLEAVYVARDDALAGNGLNNASWRPVEVVSINELNTAGPTGTQEPAIAAWKAADPQVELAQVTLAGDGRLWAAGRVTPLGSGLWRYEYAVYNENSHRSGQAFRVPLPVGVSCTNIGFHDINYHSSEIYDGTDWAASATPCEVGWATQVYDAHPNANALRWATLYIFRFDADAPPGMVNARHALFRPG
jgi:hypothetical protein